MATRSAVDAPQKTDRNDEARIEDSAGAGEKTVNHPPSPASKHSEQQQTAAHRNRTTEETVTMTSWRSHLAPETSGAELLADDQSANPSATSLRL
jgi:hypothetical protein